MNCDDLHLLLHAYMDDELNEVQRHFVDRHLAVCARCPELLVSIGLLSSALQAPELRYEAPASLRARLVAAGPARWWRNKLVASFASFGAGLAVASCLFMVRPASVAPDRELLANHLRSLMTDHLLDVASNDRHNVKPWFMGKLEFSPPVPDLSATGFPLVGGRLEYWEGQPAAALVYGKDKHRINVFIANAASAPDQVPEWESTQGYHLGRWREGGLKYAAVSDLNAKELARFVELWRDSARAK